MRLPASLYHPPVQLMFETARALGEDTRFRIYRAICDAGTPVSVTDLAGRFDLHPNAIRQHLAHLQRAGLVISPTQQGGGAGRPRRLYEPSPQPLDFAHPPRSMRSLTRLLAETVAELPPDRTSLAAFGRSFVRTWLGEQRSDGAPRSRRARAAALETALREWGWQPATSREDGALHLRTGRCLFQDVAPRVGRRCCALEEGMLHGLAEALLDGDAGLVRVEGCDAEFSVRVR